MRQTKFAKLLSTVLAAAMLVALLPVGALAEEADTGTLTASVPQATGPSNDELFGQYVETVFYSNGIMPISSTNAYQFLSANAKRYYDALKPKLIAIAQNGGSSVVRVKVSAELTQDDFEAVFTALLADLPEYLYWFNKTAKFEAIPYTDGSWDFTFPVVQAYADGAYRVTPRVAKVQTAWDNAKAIADDAVRMGNNVAKMMYFNQAICGLTDYNYDALDASTPYGDPWQLIYVFDGDDTTNVVCEGYAKAFQYLCDMSNITCYTVTGDMRSGTEGGPHMWNVVPLEGKNYIVDVTNCDYGEYGYSNDLLLVGGSTQSGVVTVSLGENDAISYKYDDDNLRKFPIATESYSAKILTPGILDGSGFIPLLGKEVNLGEVPAYTFAGSADILKSMLNDTKLDAYDNTTNKPIINFLTANWDFAPSSAAWNPKGGTYSMIAPLTIDANHADAAKYNGYTVSPSKLNGTVTVTPVTVTEATSLAPVTIAQGKLASATSYGDIGLPTEITVTYDQEIDDQGTTTGTYPITGWDMTLDQLKALQADKDYTLTAVGLPAWATVDPAKIQVTLNVTSKTPVTVTVTAPEDITYGETLADPATPKQTAIGDGGIDASATYTYTYAGAGETVYPASSAKPTNAGTYKLIATLVSDTHSGVGEAEFTISPKALANDMITIDNSKTYTYTGSAITPEYTVSDKVADVELITSNDYTAEFTNNVNAGANATLTLTGKGNYRGTAFATFTIEKASIEGLVPTITGVGKVGEVATATLPNVAASELDWTWSIGTKTVSGHTDSTYTIGSDASGLYLVVKATGRGNYTGTSAESAQFPVEKEAIRGSVALYVTESVGGPITNVVKDGYIINADTSYIIPSQAHPDLKFEWKLNGEVQSENGNAFVIPTGSNEKTVSVTVTAGGNFTGSIDSTTLIVGKTMLTGAVTIASDNAGAALVVGTVLRATVTDPDAEREIHWFRDGVDVSTGETYTISKADLGKEIYATAVGINDYTGELVSNRLTVPATAPDAPTVTVSVGNGTITVNWNTPADNGSPITGYVVSLDGVETSVKSDVHSYTYTGLTNGTAYTVKVAAVNAVDTAFSAEQTATPTTGGGGGGGGNGGGGGSISGGGSSNTTDKNVNTSGDTTTVTIDVNPTVSGDTASATLGETTVTNAIDKAVKAADKENTDPVLKIDVGGGANMNEVRTNLTADAFKAIANSDIAAVIISTDLGDIELDRAAIAAIAKQVGSGNVTLSLGKVDTNKDLNARQQAAVGDAPVFDISIQSGSTVISKIGGELTVTLPYTLKSGEKADGIEVRYLDNNGNLESMPTTYNSRTGTVTFTTTHLSLYAIAYDEAASWENPFNDVRQSDWYFDAVRYASINGLFNGTSASMFSPNASMTRSMLVTVLWRYAGEPAASGSSFSDVPAGQWYSDAVAWASANGIVSGIGEGKFAPNANVTREQIASILYRYAQSAGIVVSDSVGSGTFADQSSVSSWAVAGMNWAVKAGIISGRDGNRLAPSATASRAEVATMLQRFAVAAK